jgi:predicted PhzF superfamily epimerase YddE/YHI9
VAELIAGLIDVFADEPSFTASGAASGLLKSDELTIEQGTQMGPRSILHIRLTPQPELSAAGVIVLRGTIRLS